MVKKLLIFSFLISLTLSMMTPEELDDVVLKESIQQCRDKFHSALKPKYDTVLSPPISYRRVNYFSSVDTDIEVISDIVEESFKPPAVTGNKLQDEISMLILMGKYQEEGKVGSDLENEESYNMNYYRLEEYYGYSYKCGNYIFYKIFHISVKGTIIPLMTTTNINIKVRRAPTDNEYKEMKRELNNKSLSILNQKIRSL